MSLEEQFNSLTAETVLQYIDDHQEEHLQLEFKTVNGADLKDRPDRRNLAKAISGFANSDGGIVIWGVDAREQDGIDCACDKCEISPLSQFVSKLNEFTPQAMSPVVDGVDHRKLPLPESEDHGFAVTLVPASDIGPHMAKLGEDRYYKRSGSAFIKMEDFEIRDMMGRRQRPKLELTYVIEPDGHTTSGGRKKLFFRIRLQAINGGRASAVAPYFGCKPSPPYVLDKIGLPLFSKISARELVQFGGDSGTTIHPHVMLQVASARNGFFISETPPDFVLEYEWAARDASLENATLTISGREIKEAVMNQAVQ